MNAWRAWITCLPTALCGRPLATVPASTTVRARWIDSQTDCVCDVEPEWCDGCDDDECNGQRPEDWYHYAHRDVIRAIVGGELAPYVS